MIVFGATLLEEGKIFRVTKATPSETYSFNKKTKNLVYIMLTYPWEKRIELYVLNNQLLKVRIEKFRREAKKNYIDIFYFDRETLIFKKQESSDSQDLAELQRLFINYRNKSESIKGKLFSKKS